MSVPLDNLYDWIESQFPDPAIMYVFYPHGSRKISDVTIFKQDNTGTAYQLPEIYAHDQEILDWDLYNDPASYESRFNLADTSLWRQIRNHWAKNFNLRSIGLIDWAGIYDRAILIHSEKNSSNLEKFQLNGFLPVHYWAHAIIARDWYRYAEQDPRLIQSIKPQKTFLIYCRDWSDGREYRLKFLELLVQNNLDTVSQVSVMPVNSKNVHIADHKFKNPAFELQDNQLLMKISPNLYSSSSSAGYVAEDFVSSKISVILETAYDDNRIHLTEKTLRPIACGHPFIMAAGPGALEYLKNYGFKTFSPWIDESYDLEPNSLKRLQKIILAMKKIQNLSSSQYQEFEQQIKSTTEFNKKHFFSSEFHTLVQNELRQNLLTAFAQVKNTRGKLYFDFLRLAKKHKASSPDVQRRERTRFLRQLRQSYQRDQSSFQEDFPA